MTYEKLDNDELLRIALDAINQDHHAEAVSLLKTLLERDPMHVFATYLLAAEHAQLGMMDRAEEGFRKTVQMKPDFPIARFHLGQMHITKGDAAAARDILAPLAEGPANLPLTHYARGLIAAASEDPAGAIAHLQAGLALPQEIPALASDMQRVVGNLQAVVAAAPARAVEAPSASASLFLTGYGKSSH